MESSDKSHSKCSVYVKKHRLGRGFVSFVFWGDRSFHFDLGNGIISPRSIDCNVSAENCGDEWWLLSVAAPKEAVNGTVFLLSSDGKSTVVDGCAKPQFYFASLEMTQEAKQPIRRAPDAEIFPGGRSEQTKRATTIPMTREQVAGDFFVDPNNVPTYDDLCESFADSDVPLLDQTSINLTGLSEDQHDWRENGVVIKKKFIPEDLVDEFLALRNDLDLGDQSFPSAAPYLEFEIIRKICCSTELHYLLVDLIGEEVGLHFNLSPFKSTERCWHADDYLNPGDTFGRYVAIWFSMGEIDPDSGPFEYVPGSHRWPTMRRDKLRALIKEEHNSNTTMWWSLYTEGLTSYVVDEKIKEQRADVNQFIAGKGDILIWHSRLLHRGSLPLNPELTRPAIIGHYSNIRSRRDFSDQISRQPGRGGYFWNFGITV